MFAGSVIFNPNLAARTFCSAPPSSAIPPSTIIHTSFLTAWLSPDTELISRSEDVAGRVGDGSSIPFWIAESLGPQQRCTSRIRVARRRRRVIRRNVSHLNRMKNQRCGFLTIQPGLEEGLSHPHSRTGVAQALDTKQEVVLVFWMGMWTV